MGRLATVQIEVNGRKKIVNADDPRAAQKPSGLPSKSDIASMKKADCVEWLEAHGADTSGKIADLRDRLRSIMFVEV